MLHKRFVLILLFAATMILAAKSPQQKVITKTLTVEKGGTLEVNLNPGDVYVKTWDKNEILVKVDGLDEDETDELRITQKNGNVEIEYDGRMGWGRSAEYYFTIPNAYSIDVNTTGGDIAIQDNVKGSVQLQTMGGDIDLRSVDGNLKVETMGGDIEMSNATGEAYISTQGGNIKVGKLSGSTKEIKTMGGDISIDEVAKIGKITTFGGDISIRTANNRLECTTFGGNIEIDECKESVKADTYGGNVLIRGANGDVDVSTGGGNITLKNITGTITARTGAGDVYAELNSDSRKSSIIRTNSGSIEFYVIGNSQMTISAQVDSYHSGSGTIQSDYEGKISKNRGDMKGEFEINGGGVEVKLRATNGTIIINKK